MHVFPSLRSMGPHGPTTSFVCSQNQTFTYLFTQHLNLMILQDIRVFQVPGAFLKAHQKIPSSLSNVYVFKGTSGDTQTHDGGRRLIKENGIITSSMQKVQGYLSPQPSSVSLKFVFLFFSTFKVNHLVYHSLFSSHPPSSLHLPTRILSGIAFRRKKSGFAHAFCGISQGDAAAYSPRHCVVMCDLRDAILALLQTCVHAMLQLCTTTPQQHY